MPVNLNLLPPELSVSRNLGSLLKTLKSLGVIAVAALIVTILGVGGFFIFEKWTLNNVDAKVNSLKTQVAAQESSEQQMILLKDRLDKISLVQSEPSPLTNINSVNPLFTGLSENTSINQFTVDSTSLGLSLNLKTNSDLSAILASIKKSGAFKSVVLTSLELSPATGYTAGVLMVNK